MTSTPPSDGDLVERVSAVDVDATVRRLTRAIVDAGLQIFATIDHAAAARTAGLSMPPTVVLVYGHPKGGTPVMLACPDTALDLPLRVLVREQPDATTRVVFHAIVPLLARVGAPPEVTRRLEPVQQLLLAALA